MSTQELLDQGLVPTPGKRIRRGGLHALTGIRFFAATWVMAFHFGAGFAERAHVPRPITVFLQHGDLGVALFFMLSGFILHYTYQGNLQTGSDLYKFLVARLARLYPVYLLALVVAACIRTRLPHGSELLIFPMLQSWVPPASPLGYTWVMQAWTLSVEAFFYVCFPLLLLPFRRDWSPAALWLSSAALFAVAVFLKAPLLHPGLERTWLTSHILLPVLCLPEFTLGLVLAALFLHKQQREQNPVTRDWVTMAGILPCLAIVSWSAESRVLSAAALFCFSWAIYRLANGRGWLTATLSSKPMLLLGGASFSIYLLQGLVRTLVHDLLGRTGVDAVLSPVALIAGSCAIFLFYEEPLREVIRKLLTGKYAAPYRKRNNGAVEDLLHPEYGARASARGEYSGGKNK